MNTRKILLVFSILVATLSLSFVGYKYFDYHKAVGEYSEIQEIKNTVEGFTPNELINLEKKYTAMKEINQDYMFWINIPNTNIDYPVVYSSDNANYLGKSFKGNKSSSGTIFLDYKNKTNDFNLILHGHNMRNGTMFNNLEKFKKEDFFKNNKEIIVSTRNSRDVYEIFSVYVADASEDYLHEKYTKDYIKYIKDKSKFKTDVEIKDLDKIITLSTCSYEFDNARTVVHAVKKK